MANTFELISSVTVGSGGAASIDFTSIPSTYTDLCLKLSLRGTVSGDLQDNSLLRFNDSASGYSAKLLYGQGSGTPGSDAGSSTSLLTAEYHPGGAATINTFGNTEIYIPNYAGSNYKSVSSDLVIENNGTSTFMGIHAGLWSNTAAINKISLIAISGDSYAQYSTAYLYGVKNA